MTQGWEIKKLGEVATYVNGYAFKPEHWGETGMPIIRIQNLNNPNAEYNYCDADIPEKFVVENGDILISWSASLGVYEWNRGKAYLNQHIFKVVFNKVDINKYFLKYAVNAKLNEMLKDAHGATMKHIVKGDFDNTIIPYPPREEQERIVAELDCLSGVIERKREQLRELDALAQSIFYQMFGSVDGNHNNFEVKSLSEVFSIIKDGTHQTPQYTDDKENGIKFLSAKDVVSGTINWDNIKYIPKGLHLELHKRVAPQRNDILLCKNGTYGICALNETDEVFDIYVSLALLRPNNICIPKYLVSAINNKCTKLQFDKSIKGIGVPNLHLSEIKRTNIIVPPLTLQQEFADKIEAIEKQKELIKQSITQTEELFNSRMDYYFN